MPTDAHSLTPLQWQNHPFSWQLGAVILGILLLSGASYAVIPMVPVPITLQTLAVGLLGAVYGWRLGGLTVILWLIAAALGLPVLASGTAGIARFMGPTAGYLFAFIFATLFMGWVAERGWNERRPLLAFLGMLASNLICLILGASWLALQIGVHKAVAKGVLPFLPGAVIKSVIAVILLKSGAISVALWLQRAQRAKE